MSEAKYYTNTDMRIPPETLRDLFAGMAMLGELSHNNAMTYALSEPDNVARRAYMFADAMIAARAKVKA